MNGRGVYFYSDGSKFDGKARTIKFILENISFHFLNAKGEWREGVIFGQGTKMWPNGDVYTGENIFEIYSRTNSSLKPKTN